MTDEPLKITNADFIAAIFGDHAPEGAFPDVRHSATTSPVDVSVSVVRVFGTEGSLN